MLENNRDCDVDVDHHNYTRVKCQKWNCGMWFKYIYVNQKLWTSTVGVQGQLLKLKVILNLGPMDMW